MPFADALAAPIDVWLGPILATVGASVAALFAWLSGRDKLRNDATVVQLRADVKGLTSRVEECDRDRADLRRLVEQLTTRADRTDDRGSGPGKARGPR
jgi:hypothetical protein